MREDYYYSAKTYNMISPREIVPVVMGIVKPSSVIDVGCGLGNFLKAFKEYGVKDILGIDGSWCNKKLLFENISPEQFIERDLEENINISRRFDLAVCLEVAEHLRPQRADYFIDEICTLADIVLFSSAVPGQGGTNHFNEQALDYWEGKFNKNGYILKDILRPLFWENDKILWWYKQNTVLFVKKGHTLYSQENFTNNVLKNVIHPELFKIITDYKEPNSVKRHLKILIKSALFKLRIIR